MTDLDPMLLKLAERIERRNNLSPAEKGEMLRIRDQIVNMRAALQALQIALGLPGPIGHEAAQAIMNEAGRIVMSVSKLDTLQRHK